MDKFLKNFESQPGGTANTVVGSTAALVGILGVTAVSSTAPVTGVIIGLAGAGVAAGALYRKLMYGTGTPDLPKKREP